MSEQRLSILSAPSNLGLRPPVSGAVPGTAKAPEALREAGLYAGLLAAGASDAGVVLPGRYLDDWRPGQRLRNEEPLLEHAARLGDRLAAIRSQGDWPLVLGGDCSILLGIAVELKRQGHFGLIHLDGHTDFRHPGNSSHCASLAGEDLAAVTGKHWPQIANIGGLSPYFSPQNVVHAGCRDSDEEIEEVSGYLAALFTSAQILASAEHIGQQIFAALPQHLDGIWLQLDVDILDPSIMPAVDGPDPDGIYWQQLEQLLRVLLPRVCGLSVTVFDPDLDPDGQLARRLSRLLLDVLDARAVVIDS
ncbi:arginase family protein [Psychromicrobium lacuslunae]|uniref:Arginase n=1 Tax=Psychromicrobium lacuslunae TaxID=1618207 RepID=A0A0D4C1T0_9MICC|nr:arginase family protein [Psychromicrobium lacuslunae]AJT42533.1 arginase [Psychromicrobium lacuslunae]